MYICSQLVYTVGAIILAASRQPAAVISLSPTAGIMYATLFTMPYLLVAHYHSTGKVGYAVILTYKIYRLYCLELYCDWNFMRRRYNENNRTV